jgi:hypothetical protein
MLYAFLYPLIAEAWFSNNVTITFERPAPRTLDGEIDRLSEFYGVASSTVRAVAQCESSLYGKAQNKNYYKKTEIVDGKEVVTMVHWSTDFGFLQVNDYYHKANMDKMGLDIYNEFDSLEYGIYLMSKQGLAPWKASRTCWINKI